MCMHVKVGGQFAGADSLSTLWVLGIELRSLGVAASTFTYSTILPAQNHLLWMCFVWYHILICFFPFAHIQMLFIK